ncbi:uncharacterized protein LOC135101632 isoform X1 [Scylla paramamosain]|uniref:uncharacterized protein LOC135101632 isoform X1 n=2 Tax=Scylla paramamosain TaxID=85552 RepID=UPI003083B3E6
MEKCEVKENNKEGICKLENATNEIDTHINDTCNNNAVESLIESCSVLTNVEYRGAECEQDTVRKESRDKLGLHFENCSTSEIIPEVTSDFKASDIEGYGLPCADDILTQAESQHSVIQKNISGHVQNELSTEPSLIMANPSVTNLEENSKQMFSCTQSNISSNAELEEKLETYSIESISLEAVNENGSSELSSSTMEATVMPVNCSTESSSVLESGHYSAKDTFGFVSGEHISGSSNLDSVELGDVSTLSNVVLGDIGSLLKSSTDHPNVTEENITTDCETQVDLSIVKSEPICSDPGEEFNLDDFCSDPAEEFVLNEHNIKEEPVDSPPTPVISQEEVLLPVKIFKSEDDSDEQIITPNIRYLVEDHKQYSREEVAAALIISQSSLSPTIDMEMFQNLGKTKLTVKLSRLENMILCPKKLVLEDFSVVQLFRSNYGTSIQEWKNFFNFKTNYSVKHTGKRNKRHVNNFSSDRRKGRRGRKKKCTIEMAHSNSATNSLVFKSVEVKGEVGEEIVKGDYFTKCTEEATNACPKNEEPMQLKEEASEESSCDFEKDSKFKAESKASLKGNISKKRKKMPDHGDLENVEERSNKSNIKDENDMIQCADISTHTLKDNLQEEISEKRLEVHHQLNDACKTCLVHLYDIANDPFYGKTVRNYLKQSNENSRLLEPMKESFKEEISPSLIGEENTSEKVDNSFTGFSPVQLKEQVSLLLKNVKDLVANTGKVDFAVKEIEENASLKEESENTHETGDPDALKEGNENTGETTEPSETSMTKKKSSEINYHKKEIDNEKGMGLKKELETAQRKEADVEIKLEKDESQKEKDERRARKKQKLEMKDKNTEIEENSKERRKFLTENDLHRGKSEIGQETEGNSQKYDKKRDQFADYKKNKEDILTNKDRNPIASPLPSLASFKIPKKKVTHVQELETQEHNSVLHRRGEMPATQKSVGYSSNKRTSIHGKKRDCKERESCNVRNIKKDTKPVIPAHPHPPVVEGWAKMARLPVHSGGFYPQAGFPNMDIRCKYPTPVAHPQCGNSKSQLEMANQVRMYSGPHMGYARPPVIAKAEYNNLPSSKHGVINADKPVKQMNVPVNIPPPPPLEKLEFGSPKLGQNNGNIQSLPYESSPVMSYGYSSDGESDVSEICKTKVASSQPSQINLTDSSNNAKTEMCKVSLSSALPSLTNESNTHDTDVAEICKVSLSNAQPCKTDIEATPNMNTATCISDTSSEVILKAKEIEPHFKVTAAHESSKDKVETTGGASKDHYQHLDKKQKIRLYEKRKKYYYESRKRYHAEKGDKKRFWYKEYEKRKKEYYHLKIYLYKEKKRDNENKVLRKNHEIHSNDEDPQLYNETEASECRETSNDTAMEAEETPYSPTASPVDYDEDDYSTDVQRSLLDDAPRKQTVKEKDQERNTPSNDDCDENFYKIDVKASLLDDALRKQALDEDQEGSVLLNYPTEKLKEMIMQVMSTLHQQSGDDKCNSENQSVDSEVKFEKGCESKADGDKTQSLDSTSSFSLLAKTSGSLCVPSASLLNQHTSVTVTPVSVTSALDKIPHPVPPPSAPLSLPPLLLSKCVLKDSVSTNSASLMTDSSPQPISSSAAVLSSVSSSISNKQLIHAQSSSLDSVSSTKTLNTALPVEYSMFEKSDPEVKKEDSVLTSTPQSGTSVTSLPPLPSLEHEKEFVTECTKDSENGSGPSIPHDEMFPPLPPPPPPPEEKNAKKKSGSVDENELGLEEQNVSDDMTEVPMDIDSDDETGDCHDSDGESRVSDCHDNIRGDNLISVCHDIDKGGTEIVICCDNDKEYLSKFGICEKKSPSLEKEMDEDDSTDNLRLTKLLKKLMKMSNANKPGDITEKDYGSSAGMKEITTDLTVDKASSCLDSAVLDQQEVEDCNPLREQSTPSVHSPDIGRTVSSAKNKETMKMGPSARQLEVTSVFSDKQDEKERCDTTRANFMNEIEIIGMKEPRKNLICVDEILMSVEAADHPPDLQIIYTDLRSGPSEMRNTIRDEVPKYYQKTALAQMLVDKCKDIPLVGLQYVLEVRKDLDMTLDGCYYICAVCSKKMTAHTLVAHIKSVPHRLKFSETHCKHIYDRYASYDLKEWTASLVKEFTLDLAQIEKKMGRHKLAVAFEREISSVLKSLKQKIVDISNLSQLQEEKAKVLVNQAPSSVAPVATKSSKPITSVAGDVKEVPLPDSPMPKSSGKSVLSKNDIPLPPKPKSPGSKGGNISKNYDDEEQDVEDVIVTDVKNAANAKKFSSNGQGFTKRNYRPGPNARSRSSSGSTTPTLSPRKTWSRSKSRSKSRSPKRMISHSPSNKQMKHGGSPRRKPDRPIYMAGRKRRQSRSPVSPRHHSRSKSSPRDIRKRYRTRSRSRSRHRSSYRRKDSRSHRSPIKRESSEERARRVARRKLEDFREAEVRIKARHRNQQIVYEKTPESHPLYNREWKIFWERRCRELEKDGVDPFLYDFKTEWARFWLHRMKELMDKSYKTKREGLLRKFRLEDPDLEENKLPSKPPSSSWRPSGESVERLSRIDRSPSPWEQDEGAPGIARNPSPVPREAGKSAGTEDSSKFNEISTSKFEDDFSVIGTLKLLNELEDQLGSFGPAISTLLGKAVDCSQKGEDTLELFKDPDNLVLVRYAREKLSSQISAGILGVTALVRTQMAVERSMWLQSQAEELANEGKYLGLDIAGIARATLGRDTVQIAQYIAQHLLQVGKSNASEADLQNILYAVLAAHTKLLVETSKKAQVDTSAIESAAPVSTPVVTVPNNPPKKLPPASTETSEGTKPPLFPSTVGDDRGEDDKEESDGDSSDKMGGLSLLQNAYKEENGKEMENLSLEDLRSLLANFNSLNPEEKQALTTYLKKLEATDSKKVMKLREEIQKSAKTGAKAGSTKSALKSGKSSVRSQSVSNTNSNNHASQQQPSEGTQELIPEKKHCPEMPPLQTNDDRSSRPHSMENTNQTVRVPQQDRFIGSSEMDVMHESRGMLEPSASLDPPLNNMPPAPVGMTEMAHEFGQSISRNPDHRPHHINQPMFEDNRNRTFPPGPPRPQGPPGPPGPFMERQEPGFGMSEPHKYNLNNPDRNFDRFGYEPMQGPHNPIGPQGLGRYNRPPEPNNPQWQGFGRGGPRMDDCPFPPRDEMNYNWFDDGPQPTFEQRDFAPRGRPDYPFRGGPRRGHHPNTRQPYREPW